MMMNHPSALSDIELTAEVRRLAGGARETTVTLIGHLMEFDTRRLYLGAGFGSLFAYCTEVLRLSEEETCNRIQAARAAGASPAARTTLPAARHPGFSPQTSAAEADAGAA